MPQVSGREEVGRNERDRVRGENEDGVLDISQFPNRNFYSVFPRSIVR